jgi:hypothetical protein
MLVPNSEQDQSPLTSISSRCKIRPISHTILVSFTHPGVVSNLIGDQKLDATRGCADERVKASLALSLRGEDEDTILEVIPSQPYTRSTSVVWRRFLFL